MPGVDEARPTTITHRFVVENECDGWRLDRFLQKRIPRLSRVRLQRVIRGGCWVDDRACRPSTPVAPGQVVRFIRPAPVEPEVPRELGVLHDDPTFFVLDKPAGIAMHPTAKFHYATVTAVLRERFPGEHAEICHRLDLETSGALVVGRSKEATVALKRAFARREIEKRYLAIVHLRTELAEAGAIDLPLGLEVGGITRVKMVVTPVEQGGPAVAHALSGARAARFRRARRVRAGDRTPAPDPRAPRCDRRADRRRQALSRRAGLRRLPGPWLGGGRGAPAAQAPRACTPRSAPSRTR